ncbi:MAG: hypothetical protein P4L46_20700 [Fimbriimonas sp.]|nr:hypothetical protein [Fimbriimonas sp.]
MAFDPRYMADVVEGRFCGSTRTQLSQVFSEFKGSPNRYLILHFHGGLVDRDTAIDEAVKLNDVYSPVASVLCPIWETGLFEVLRRNWESIAADALYKILIQRVSGAVHEKATSVVGTSSTTIPQFNLGEMRDSAQGPGEFANVDTTDWHKVGGLTSIDSKTVQHQFQGDHELISGIRHIAAAHHAANAGDGLRGLLDEGVALAEAFVADVIDAARDLVGFPSKFILEIVETVDAVLQRFASKTDHGLHATVTEEILRKFYVDLLGFEIWQQMKVYTEEAFGSDQSVFFGTALLEEMAALDSAKKCVLLVGHSAGSIYACNLLQHARARKVQVPIQVVFLAAAVHDDLFAETLDEVGPISDFRLFSMSDQIEQEDNLLGGFGDGTLDWVYPRSLLYFISGCLEATVDAPIAGLQRDVDPTWQGAGLPSVATVRGFLTSGTNRTVWTKTEAPGQNRLSANAIDHGDFGHPELTSGVTKGQPNLSVHGITQIAATGNF